jgi:Flp pilus assembly pilin Flp
VRGVEVRRKERPKMWRSENTRRWGSRFLALYMSATLWLTRVGRRLWAEERGQSMVEYAVVVALIAIIAMAAVQAFGQGISTVFQQLLSKIQSLGS